MPALGENQVSFYIPASIESLREETLFFARDSTILQIVCADDGVQRVHKQIDRQDDI
jgi:hypothetical protein